MVIGKTALSQHLKSPSSKVVEERGRISYAAKREKAGAWPVIRRQGHRKLRNAKDVRKLRRGVEDGALRVTADHGLDGGDRRLNASGNHHNVGAPDCGNRLAQAPCRQNQSATEWIGGVDENNIGIASQTQMLKAIVEEKPFGSMP